MQTSLNQRQLSQFPDAPFDGDEATIRLYLGEVQERQRTLIRSLAEPTEAANGVHQELRELGLLSTLLQHRQSEVANQTPAS